MWRMLEHSRPVAADQFAERLLIPLVGEPGEQGVVGRRRANGTWVRVEDVIDTGEWEPVYNLHVTDHHTYFVTE